jgi:hypothetical protein
VSVLHRQYEEAKHPVLDVWVMVTMLQPSPGIICSTAFPITTQEIKLVYFRSHKYKQAFIMAVITDFERIMPDPGQEHVDAASMLRNMDVISSAGQLQRMCSGNVLKQAQLLCVLSAPLPDHHVSA